MIPFEFKNTADFDKLEQGDLLRIDGIRKAIGNRESLTARIIGKTIVIPLVYNISERQVEIILKGGAINHVKQK